MKQIFHIIIIISCLVITSLKPQKLPQSNKQHPSILLVHIAPSWGGISQHITKLYNTLKEKSYDVTALLSERSRAQKEFVSHGWDHYTFKKKAGSSYTYQLIATLTQICTERHIDIIHFNWPAKAASAAKEIKLLFPHITTIFTHHGPFIPKPATIKSCDYFSCVSHYVQEQVNQRYAHHLHNAQALLTPPCFNETKFDSFVPPQESAQEFFKNNFNLTLKPYPIICMVANLSACKNHLCMLRALQILVHEYNMPTYLMLAGEGSLRKKLETARNKMKLQPYVHFLGYVKTIPELLYYSQLKVLSSRHESFGVCLLEAGLMKRPVVLATETGGANSIVLDEKTGLLFKNNDAKDLAKKIKRLLDNKAWARQLGENAYHHIKTNYSSAATVERFVQLYQRIYQH